MFLFLFCLFVCFQNYTGSCRCFLSTSNLVFLLLGFTRGAKFYSKPNDSFMKAFHSERCLLIVDSKNDLIKSVLNQGKYFVISHFICLLCPSNVTDVTELDKEYIKLLTWPLLKYFLSLS